MLQKQTLILLRLPLHHINPSWWAAVAASSVALLSWCWPPFIHQLSINRSVWGSLWCCRNLCGSMWGANVQVFNGHNVRHGRAVHALREDNVYQGVERWSGFKSTSALTTINNSLAPSQHNRLTMPPFTINYLLLLILVVTRIIDKHMPISARSWSCHCQKNIWNGHLETC